MSRSNVTLDNFPEARKNVAADGRTRMRKTGEIFVIGKFDPHNQAFWALDLARSEKKLVRVADLAKEFTREERRA